MKHITTAIGPTIAPAALRRSWSMDAATRQQAQGEPLEAWAGRMASRWGYLDAALYEVVSEVLNNH